MRSLLPPVKQRKDDRVRQVLICTPDKDLSQCVVGTRVVQLDRRRDILRDEAGVVAKFGVKPQSIPDYLAVVGDSADGFPGLSGMGRKGRGSYVISVPPPGRHSEGLARMASINPEGPLAVRIAIQRMERRAVVSHAGNPATGCARF